MPMSPVKLSLDDRNQSAQSVIRRLLPQFQTKLFASLRPPLNAWTGFKEGRKIGQGVDLQH